MGGKVARAILIDDDPEFHETFRKALESVAVETGFPVELACTSGTGMDGYEAEGFDIYFVDIELGQESGIELASELQRRCSGREFIFVSAHEDYVWRSMLARLRSFLRKRVLEEDLREAMVFQKKLWERRYARVKVGRAEVCPQTVLWCESNDHYIDIHLDNGDSILIRARMSQLEGLLSGYHFIRIHNRLLVNLEHVWKLEGNQVFLKDKMVLQISRTYQKKAQEGMKKWFEDLYLSF